MTNIYILQLKENKYYIGKTTNTTVRINQHFNTQGSYWTKLYKPVKVVDIIKNCDKYDEDKYTLQYMEKYGIDNVRGGSFCKEVLSKESMTTINQMLNSTKDTCYNCGKSGHFINKCPIQVTKKQNCNRCGRDSHTEEKCYAKKDIDNNNISDSEEYVWACEYCDEEFETEDLVAKHVGKCVKNDDKCYRCKREGHCQLDCYAKTSIRGKYLSK